MSPEFAPQLRRIGRVMVQIHDGLMALASGEEGYPWDRVIGELKLLLKGYLRGHMERGRDQSLT